MPQKNKFLWLFSGTSDGNQIAKDLLSLPLKVFVATEYGMRIAAEVIPRKIIEVGRLTADDIFKRGQSEPPEKVIDATHPFAVEISKNLIEFCQTHQIPYFRYERPEEIVAGQNIHLADNVEQAAVMAADLGKNIFLTLGSKNIEPFMGEDLRNRIFIRMLPDPQLIQHLLSKGVSPDRIIAIQGPFSISLNRAMMSDRSIDCLVTKSSGKEGGVPEKIAAAKELGIPVIVIKRPEIDYPNLFNDKEKLVAHLNI